MIEVVCQSKKHALVSMLKSRPDQTLAPIMRESISQICKRPATPNSFEDLSRNLDMSTSKSICNRSSSWLDLEQQLLPIIAVLRHMHFHHGNASCVERVHGMKREAYQDVTA